MSLDYDKSNLKARKSMADEMFETGRYDEAFDHYKLLRNSTKALQCLDKQMETTQEDHSLLIKKGQYLAEIYQFCLQGIREWRLIQTDRWPRHRLLAHDRQWPAYDYWG